MQAKIYIISALLLSSTLSACTKEYNREAITDYVEENLNLSDFTVSKTYRSIKDSDGYTDKLWTVTDETNHIEFHVLDDFYWGMETMANSLKDDYDDAVFISLYKTMDKHDDVTLTNDTSNSLYEVTLSGYFTNRESLRKCFDSLLDYHNQIENHGFQLAIRYFLLFDSPIRTIGDYEITEGDTHGQLNILSENDFNKALTDYFTCALSYQLDENTAEMTPEELNQVMTDEDTYTIRIIYDDGTTKQYDDIIANSYAYGISFGALFKILSQEAFPVDGNSWHYTVAWNGNTYEFSYDFRENDYYYYKVNDSCIPMDYYFYNCLTAKEIEELFGLQLDDCANRNRDD